MKAVKFFGALSIIMGFTMSAMAQPPQSDNDKVDAKAQVVAQVDVTKVEDLIFGMVTPGNTKTINSLGQVLAGQAGAGVTIGAEKAGQFSVTKGLNTQVTLGFTLPTSLTFDAHNLAINFIDAAGVKLARLAAFNGAQADLLFTPADGIVVANSGATAAYFADDDFYVFIGGTVVPTTGQPAGVYVGEITLTATYN